MDKKVGVKINYREKIRKAIDCPQFNGGFHYGEWGALRFEQRVLIKRLLDELDGADEYIKSLYKKNEQLNSLVNSCQEEIRQLKQQLEEQEKIIDKIKIYLIMVFLKMVVIVLKFMII